MRRGALAAILVFVAADAAACTAILGVTDIPPAPDAGPGGASPDAPGGCPVRYVSQSGGSDKNDGCSTSRPFQTIKAAVAAVENAGQAGYTIEVCAGTYPETDLIVSLAGSVLGGYDCQGWKRTKTYGYPSFDMVNETVVVNAAPSSNSNVTLAVKAAPVDGGTPLLLDGLTFRGPGPMGDTIAVQVTNSSNATFSNCRILAGDATTGSTYAVKVSGASPTLTNDQIVSGVAMASTGQSVGILASGASPKISFNNISGSASASAGAVYGILVQTTGAMDLTAAAGAPIAGNSITAATGFPSIGIQISGPVTADVLGNIVQPTKAEVGPDGGTTVLALGGLSSSQSAPLRVIGNRLYGGGSSTPGDVRLRALNLSGVPHALVANNMIYGGYHDPGGTDVTASSAVELFNCDAPVVDDNTIMSGFGGATSVYSVMLTGSTTGAVLRNNILVGAGDQDTGLFVVDCTDLAALEHNLFVGYNDGTVSSQHCAGVGDGGAGSATDISKIAGLFTGSASIDGNLIMTGKCSANDTADSDCLDNVACPPPNNGGSSNCLSTVFPSGWSSHNGYTLWGTGGWTLQPGLSCRIIHGGLDLTDAGITTDYHDAARGPMQTLGAVESDASCAP